MRNARLLTTEQLNLVFSNLEDLIDGNSRFLDMLQDAIELAVERGDEVRHALFSLATVHLCTVIYNFALQDFTSVKIGEIFLDCATAMLVSYECYCLNHCGVGLILDQLQV